MVGRADLQIADERPFRTFWKVGTARSRQRMSHFFKEQCNAQDLRSLQSAVLWEWAITTCLPLHEAAAKFTREHRSFWPLTQLGDPLIPADRMFGTDADSVHRILEKLEERYGKYDTCSATDLSKNTFQSFANRQSVSFTTPVWCRNTQTPRAHAEKILRKYGVPKHNLPSQSPGIRMVDFFRHDSSHRTRTA